MDKNERVAEIVKKYMGKRTLRDFASKLTDGVGGLGITGQAVHYWIHGVYKPSISNLMTLITQTSDWRRDFALEVLKEVYPEFSKRILFLNR